MSRGRRPSTGSPALDGPDSLVPTQQHAALQRLRNDPVGEALPDRHARREPETRCPFTAIGDMAGQRLDPAGQRPGTGLKNEQPPPARLAERLTRLGRLHDGAAGAVGHFDRSVAGAPVDDDHVADDSFRRRPARAPTASVQAHASSSRHSIMIVSIYHPYRIAASISTVAKGRHIAAWLGDMVSGCDFVLALFSLCRL
jgi:hypothetical protein